VTIAEALGHEVPVVVSNAAPWSEVESTVGSSRSTTSGSWSTAQAMLRRRFIPPEND
jgi:hypothetical protein